MTAFVQCACGCGREWEYTADDERKPGRRKRYATDTCRARAWAKRRAATMKSVPRAPAIPPRDAFKPCSEPGCHARVMVSGPHEKCQRHREANTRQAIHDTVQRMRERAGF